jgi:hypothetical protein
MQNDLNPSGQTPYKRPLLTTSLGWGWGCYSHSHRFHSPPEMRRILVKKKVLYRFQISQNNVPKKVVIIKISNIVESEKSKKLKIR